MSTRRHEFESAASRNGRLDPDGQEIDESGTQHAGRERRRNTETEEIEALEKEIQRLKERLTVEKAAAEGITQRQSSMCRSMHV